MTNQTYEDQRDNAIFERAKKIQKEAFESGRQSAQKEFEKLIDEWAKEKYWDDDNECILTEEDIEKLKSKLKSATTKEEKT